MSRGERTRTVVCIALLAVSLAGCSLNGARDNAMDEAMDAYDKTSVSAMGSTSDCIEAGYNDWNAERGCYNH